MMNMAPKYFVYSVTFSIIYTPSVPKYKMFLICEANISKHVLVCIFEWTYALKKYLDTFASQSQNILYFETEGVYCN
jgi:hypothetical protein